MIDIHPTMNTISVTDDICFLMNSEINAYSLRKSDSTGIVKSKLPPEQIIKSINRGMDNGEKRIWESPKIMYHDLCLKDENIIVSTSDSDKNYHSIINITPEGATEIYKGDYPRSRFTSKSLREYTLRIDLSKGALYFPRENGISRWTPEGPLEMLKDYLCDDSFSLSPLTKFAVGDEFMVASAYHKSSEGIPLLQVFKPKYETTGIVGKNSVPLPSSFKREQSMVLPKYTASSITGLDLAAHGNKFAMTHHSFKKVFVYHVK